MEMLIEVTEEELAIENCFLCAVFIDEVVLDMCRASKIGPNAFGSPFNRKVIASMFSLVDDGLTVNIATLAKILSESGEENAIMQVMAIDGKVETTMHAKTHWGQIVDAWRNRNFKELTQKLGLIALESSSWEETHEKSREIIAELGDSQLVEVRRSQVEVAQAVIDDTKRVMDGKELLNSNPIKTGIDKIDSNFRPLDVATGDFSNIIFGATGTGKSSLANQIAGYNIFQGKRVLIFLGESNHESLLTAMAAQRTEVNSDNRILPHANPQDKERFIECLEEMKAMHDVNFSVFDDDFFIEDIIARCRISKKEMGPVDLIIIDHLHCLKTRKQFGAKEERQRFNYMSGELKPLGMMMNCPTITLAQPSRDFKTSNRPPVESDLKESGNLEDDADRIWGLWLPDKDSDGNEQSKYSTCPEIKAFQLKFKRGRTSIAKLRFRMEHTKFYDPDEKAEEDEDANPTLGEDF